jgi:transcription initiation factor TFIIIB Brf1 subunit/transcription initiation factor TFIIB
MKMEQYSENLICDICNSDDITETEQGYVCRSCGIVLEAKKLIYNHPRNEEAVQYSPINNNQIGFMRERLRNKHSRKLLHMNKLNNIKSREESIKTEVKVEVKRIFEYLALPKSYLKEVIGLVLEIRSKLGKGTKYRAVSRLVPVVIYIALKMKFVPINQYDLLEVSKIDKKDFNAFKLQVYSVKPEYIERNRRKYIARRLYEIRESFDLDMTFYRTALTILNKMWGVIKNTTDDVVAGLVSSITILCNYRDEVTVSSICDMLGIRMSSIQSQVKRRIFDRLQIIGFQSLVKSSDLLRNVMEKLGFLHPKMMELPEQVTKKEGMEEGGTEVHELYMVNKDNIESETLEVPEIFKIEIEAFNNQNKPMSVFIITNKIDELLIAYPTIENNRPIDRRQKSGGLASGISLEILCLKGAKGPPVILP